MIRITVELVPQGDEAQKREIGRMEIANWGGSPECADYTYAMRAEAWENIPKEKQTGVILNFKRRQCNVWDLIYAALDHAFAFTNRSRG